MKPIPHVAPSIAYRKDIDGLRSIAVLAVLLYHANVAPFSGGFVGVDVFFVISGYLIMATLATDMRLGRLSVRAFYDRRIRRIFPALFTAAAFSLIAAALLFPPPDFVDFGRTLMAMAFFVSNVFFFQDNSQAGYFATGVDRQLLLHTWSLSVEEQFYIFLPMGLYFLRSRDERVLKIWLLGLSLVSFCSSMWMAEYHPIGAFYLVFPRAWELLVGALLALELLPKARLKPIKEIAAGGGLGLILYAIFDLSKDSSFPGANALFPCIGAALIIYAGGTTQSMVGRLLGLRPLVFVGRISYSLYLWHWPIIVIVKNLNTGKLNAPSTILIIVSSLIAATMSYKFVEQPFRSRKRIFNQRHVLVSGVMISLVGFLVGGIVVWGDGFPGRYSLKTRSLITANLARESDHPNGDCENWRTPVAKMDDIRFCPLGRGETKKILFWGDSHMGSLRPLVGSLYHEGSLGGRGAIFSIAASCVPDPHMNRLISGYYCQTFSRLALERAKSPDIEVVFIAFSAWWDLVNGQLCQATNDRCDRTLSIEQAEDLFIEDLRSEVNVLHQLGKIVVISLPAPAYNLFIPRKEINDAILGNIDYVLRDRGIIRRLKRNDYFPLRDRIIALATATGAKLYDPRDSICKGDFCIYENDGVSVYSDDGHFANSRIGIFHDALRAALN